jgi:predicted CxxxxCH...CXXCH cytochrome family protein
MLRFPRWILFVLVGLIGVIMAGMGYIAARSAPASASKADQYKVLAWNDLGMHCYNRDFQDIAVLPPFNNLWAQVVLMGDPPQVVTSGITVTYEFADNTYSVGKSNFWTYAEALFGVALADNIGLTGKGLSGQMDVKGDHFEAVGIPLTEFSDSAPTKPAPYQLATIIVRDTASGQELTRMETVAPVSTEMHCGTCHDDYGRASPDIATGRVGTNILAFHDAEEHTDLMASRPVLCANCHASNALGKPGVVDVPSLSNAMHEKHAGEVANSIDGCYNCHPGPQTRCLRDVMSQRGMTCIDCHGSMETVAQNNNPWLNEPRCDNVACHGGGYAQNQALYRVSTGHGGLFCEACHDSTHAIAPSSQPSDGIKFLGLQGYLGTLRRCTVCHATQPAGAGPHGLITSFHFLPLIVK